MTPKVVEKKKRLRKGEKNCRKVVEKGLKNTCGRTCS